MQKSEAPKLRGAGAVHDASTRMPNTTKKRPFRIDVVLARIRSEVRRYRDAAMFELRDRGHGSLFEQLIACILSIRTRDEVSLPVALRLFERVRTPAEICALDLDSLISLIHGTSFAEAKAVQIAEIARRTVGEYGGELPADPSVLMGFKGVGPKCAHLALGVACGLPHISVDVHVWRVVNRWGYVSAPTPEATMLALEDRLPQRYWIEINRLLVPFGKHVCTGTLPKCSTCPVLAYCRQVGVTEHR